MSMLKSGIKIMKDDGGPKALLAGLGPTTFGYDNLCFIEYRKNYQVISKFEKKAL